MPDLLHPTEAHDGHPVGDGHGLLLVVGDEDGGHAEALVELLDLAAHAHAQRRIEVAEGLVEEEHGRLADEGATQRHALLLAARELARQPVEELRQLERLGHAPRTRSAISALGRLRRRSVKPMFSPTVMCG